MPRTKLDADPKIDWPVAALLYRKLVLGYTWEDIAEKAGMNGATLRKTVSTRPSDEWPVYVLKKALQAVGLSYKSYLENSPEDK